MRILHVVHGYPPSIGGTQRLVEKISLELSHRHGDEVTVFTTVARNMDHFIRDDGQALPAGTTTMDGVQVRRFPVFNRLTRARMLMAGLSFRWRLPGNEICRTLLNGPIVFGMTRAIASSRAEVVMAAPFPQLNMYSALRGARRAGVPIVLCGALHVEDRWNYDREMIFRAIEKADAYVALTQFEKDHVVARGISPEKIHVIGGGVDLDTYSDARGDDIRREHGFGEDPVVAMVSKQVERKRFDVLLDAMERVWKEEPSARVLLAGGSTAYTPTLEARIAQMPETTRRRVTLLSDFDEQLGPELFAAADLLVLPSGQDSFGLVFVEAWACRKPVIGVDLGATASVIDHEEDGLLVRYDDREDLAQAILRLLGDSDLRVRLGESGYEKVRERYSWTKVGQRFRELYQSL